MWYFIVGVLALAIGIWLGRSYFRPSASFEGREQAMLDEARKQAEEKASNILKENEVRILNIQKQNSITLESIQNSLKNEIALAENKANNEITNFQLENELKKRQLTVELNSLQAEKREREKLLMQLQSEIANYEKAVSQTKIRILQKTKAERELELKNLNDHYDALMVDAAEAINLIKRKLDE